MAEAPFRAFWVRNAYDEGYAHENDPHIMAHGAHSAAVRFYDRHPDGGPVIIIGPSAIYDEHRHIAVLYRRTLGGAVERGEIIENERIEWTSS
jgi:hypothetical protein